MSVKFTTVENVERTAVWWAWGDGGHRITTDANNDPYPEKVFPKVPGQLNNPLPQELLFKHESRLAEVQEEYGKELSGWVTKPSRSNPVFTNIWWFLKPIGDNEIHITKEMRQDMWIARNTFLSRNEPKWIEPVPMHEDTSFIMSEIALYDADLVFVGSMNVFVTLNTIEDYVFSFQKPR